MNDWDILKKAMLVTSEPEIATRKAEIATRNNEGKLKWSLVDFESLKPMVRTLMFGAEKYDPENWKKGLVREEILESIMRHLIALLNGEENDSESGISHMGHIQCNAMFYNHFAKNDTFAVKKQ